MVPRLIMVSVSLLLLLFNCSVVSESLQPHGLQSTRLPRPSLSPRVCPSSCPLIISQCMHMSNHRVSVSKTNVIVCQLYFNLKKKWQKRKKKPPSGYCNTSVELVVFFCPWRVTQTQSLKEGQSKWVLEALPFSLGRRLMLNGLILLEDHLFSALYNTWFFENPNNLSESSLKGVVCARPQLRSI